MFKPKAIYFEKEIENIMAWKSQLDAILDPKNP